LLVGPSLAGAESPSHLAVRYGDQALSFFSGFIREEMPFEGVVAKTSFNRQVMGQGDTVYLRMRHPEEIQPGALYTVYRNIHKVFHPISRRYMGNLISVLGVVEVKKMTGDLATVKIVRTYFSIYPGDAVMPFVIAEPETTEGLLPPDEALPEAPGFIVDMQAPRTLIAQRHFVYLDWGRDHGLHAGDRLEVLRRRAGYPTEPIGELQVLALEDTTATAMVMRSAVPLAIGDQVVPMAIRDRATGVSFEAPAAPRSAAVKRHDALTKSLAADIAKGDVSVENIGDTLKISLNDLVNQLEYEPGQAQIKPTGEKILKQIAGFLRQQTADQILVEGHTDNMPIGPTLLKRYPSNRELSEARANLIVRYFTEQGLNPSDLSAVGYADTRPVTSNASELGRKRNRRIEVVLTPKAPEAGTIEELEAPGSAQTEVSEPFHVNVPKAEERPQPEQPEQPQQPASPVPAMPSN
ncbi:MAG TPA: OmpA family protein, partial [Nitrospiraceae bacterium]|nr:OmpA family protein [Nitrospiraceae bacterium]